MKRRQFLTTSLFAGTGCLLLPHARAQGANDELRVAVIGLNGRGQALMNSILKAKGARLVALCDVDSVVLDKTAEAISKQNLTVAKYGDYRKLCESKEIDAVAIATPNHTHALIATTAAANGKHVYVEKPVSHNVWEGRRLADAQAKYGVVIQHGFQRRSEACWEEAITWLKDGNIGKMTLARGFCYKPRPSIGKVSAPVAPPPTVDYDLWSGPREMLPVQRTQFHYDWHWQQPYGNGDLGNQGPHQLDVCRWALGDPGLPTAVLSAGARLGYEDDGQWPNTQLVWLDYDPVPILFEVRGLPNKGMDYKGQSIGNVIECEGGWLAGGHEAGCNVYDREGKTVKSFRGSSHHMQAWVDSCHSGKQRGILSAESGHLSAVLAHLGNISWKTGSEAPVSDIRTAFSAPAGEAIDRLMTHLEANQVDLKKAPLKLGTALAIDPKAERFTGPGAEEANALLKGEYRKGFELPV
jgi:predicted dehydrogenase